ncbi:hypothetical protein ACFSYD_11715 [Paracoccus aerius]
MADDIAVTLLLTRDGIDVTSEIIGGRILNAPAGEYVATWMASDGVLPSVAKTESLTVEEPPSGQVPAIIGGIADRSYTVGQSVPATDLRTKFAGATSYVISPAVAAAVIDGYDLVFDASSALEETSFAVRGVNAAGQSDPVSFKLTIEAAQQEPAIEIVSIEPSPLVAGQPFTITFNVSLDANEVSASVPLVGAGTARSGTAPTDDTVNVSGAATKAGYTSLPFVYDVVPASPSATTTADNKVILNNVTPQSDPFSFTIGQHPAYAGDLTVAAPSDLGTGPVSLIAPSISGTPAHGQKLTARPGLYGSLHSSATIFGEWYRGEDETGITSLDYLIDSAVDGGKALTYREAGTDASGTSEMVSSNSIVVPSQQPASYTSAGTGAVYNTTSQTQHTIAAVPLGEANADRFIELDLNAYLITDTTAVITGISIRALRRRSGQCRRTATTPSCARACGGPRSPPARPAMSSSRWTSRAP